MSWVGIEYVSFVLRIEFSMLIGEQSIEDRDREIELVKHCSCIESYGLGNNARNSQLENKVTTQ